MTDSSPRSRETFILTSLSASMFEESRANFTPHLIRKLEVSNYNLSDAHLLSFVMSTVSLMYNDSVEFISRTFHDSNYINYYTYRTLLSRASRFIHNLSEQLDEIKTKMSKCLNTAKRSSKSNKVFVCTQAFNLFIQIGDDSYQLI